MYHYHFVFSADQDKRNTDVDSLDTENLPTGIMITN